MLLFPFTGLAGPAGREARAVKSAGEVAGDARAARYAIYETDVKPHMLCPRPPPISWNVIVTVIGVTMAFSTFWMAVLIVAMMVAALGSLVMLAAKTGLITSASRLRSSSSSIRGRKEFRVCLGLTVVEGAERDFRR